MSRARLFLLGLLLAFLLAVGVVLRPAAPAAKEIVTVTVPEGSSVREIAQLLTEAGVLRRRFPFVALAVLTGSHNNLQAGRYAVSARETPREILRRMTAGQAVPADLPVTIPEGFTLEQIAARLAARGVVGAESFREAAVVAPFREVYPFLADAPSDASLEGYLFPETYRFAPGTSPEAVLRRFLDEFRERLDSARRETARPVPDIFTAVTLASIVEREVRGAEDRARVAGILWKRLRTGRGLEVDATLRYVLQKWDTPLTATDLQTDSPYNTRKYRGLPPGPVGNPGMESLRAVFHPQESDFLYYLSAPDGTTIFSRTLEEHAAARRRYLPQGEFTGR